MIEYHCPCWLRGERCHKCESNDDSPGAICDLAPGEEIGTCPEANQ